MVCSCMYLVHEQERCDHSVYCSDMGWSKLCHIQVGFARMKLNFTKVRFRFSQIKLNFASNAKINLFQRYDISSALD